MKYRALVIVGTRPEAIKLAPVISCLKESALFRVSVCATAQHRELLDQVFSVFGIVPDFDLDVMRPDQNQFELVTRILGGLATTITQARPHILLVQGDTSTAFIAAFAAFHRRVPIAHVEAGLRTYKKYSPFPEEVNRRLISCMADLHFAPTKDARQNLLAEGVAGRTIYVTGNTSIDALRVTRQRILDKKAVSHLPASIESINGRMILVTAHRRESFGKPFENICRALLDIAEQNPDVQIVYPVHPNPNVQGIVRRTLSRHRRVHLIEPQDYVSFVDLMDRAHIILTDSGGIQEEALFLKRPVLVMRTVTERGEAVRAGGARLIGVGRQRISREADLLLNSLARYKSMVAAKNPFGDGHAADAIVGILERNIRQLSRAVR